MNDYLFLKYKKIVMIATTPIAIIDGAKTAIIQLAIQYATNTCFCLLFISE